MIKKSGKNLLIASLSIILVVILSISIYAAGSSTGGYNAPDSITSTTPTTTDKPTQDTNAIEIEKQAVASASSLTNKSKTLVCESQSTLNARIKCRLEQRGISALNVTEESCRVLANPANCQSLYAKVASCYNLISGQQKDQCFKRIAGFTSAKVKEEASANNKEALRNYLIFLLYDLQERVEKAYENNAITSEQTSETISLIVQIKQKILQNQTKSQVKPFIQELKAKVQELKLT